MFTKGKRRATALLLTVMMVATTLVGYASASGGVGEEDYPLWWFYLDLPAYGITDLATPRTKDVTKSYAAYDLRTVNNNSRNQVDGRNLLAFIALGLNISGGSLIDRKHFMPTVGAHHRSGTHGRGGTDSFQHFIHSLCWALVHRHPSFILRIRMDHDSSILAAQSGNPVLLAGFPVRIGNPQRNSLNA